MVPFSILDLATVTEGSDIREAMLNARRLAQHGERLGYKRFWLAEHHNMPGIASAATVVLLGYVAEGTERIRVGSGGIMLPNHTPYVVAEQFGTLATLYPDRIDLGVGRAPGTDPLTARALRRYATSVDRFPEDVVELMAWFDDEEPGQLIRAVPGAGLHVPVWILGSSTFGAQLAAQLGLPYAFASHFAPDALHRALEVYRSDFKPSRYLDAPYAMAAFNVLAADDGDEARRQFTSVQQQFLTLRRNGTPGPLPRPVDSMEGIWRPEEERALRHTLQYSGVGTKEEVRDAIVEFLEATKVDELMITGQIFDPELRMRSFEIAAEIRDELAKS